MKFTNELRDSPRPAKYFLGGSLMATFAASLCCVGPLLAATFGLGAFTAAGFFHTLRPVFLALALMLVAAAWIWEWRKRRRPIDGEGCKNGCRNDSRILLVILSAVVLILAFSPYLLNGVVQRTLGDASVGTLQLRVAAVPQGKRPAPLGSVASWPPTRPLRAAAPDQPRTSKGVGP